MILQANGTQRKASVAIFISDQTDFKITKVTDRYEWIFYNATSSRYNIYQYIYTQAGNIKIHNATAKLLGRN